MAARRRLSPNELIILGFALIILCGTVLLRLDVCRTGAELSWLDALFTATSATCVTGLAVVDTGTFFSPVGQGVLLGLIQVGGLGVMTYTSLVFLLWRKRISLSDRTAVRQSLLQDPSFRLGAFLRRVVFGALAIEAVGAALLWLLDPAGFAPWSALFHSVSAFCNAGFGLYADSLVQWRADAGVNLVFMALIVLGGLGFAVLIELGGWPRAAWRRLRSGRADPGARLSWHARVVLSTSLWLVLGGAAALFLAEFALGRDGVPLSSELLSALFQSVTSRTAGFNTLDIGGLTNISLLVIIALMFIGGSPGSCAGGVKTTTFRALLGFSLARIMGRRQAVVRRFALDEGSLNDALTLILYGIVIVGAGTLALCITELGPQPHAQTRGMFLELLFECVSAFGTVGLSAGVTGELSPWGRLVVTLLMFVGRLGPIVFIGVLHDMRRQEKFTWPEKRLPIG
jgi:trk system potassium uptake protein TrkH